AITTALYRRERTDEGEYIDLGMLDATLPWLTKQAGRVFAGEKTERMGTKDPVLAPYQTYETGDGHINVACLNPRLWRAFAEAIGRPELVNDDRFESNADRVNNMEALEQEIESALAAKTTDEWMDVLIDAGVPAGPVQSVEEALYNEQTQARNAITSIERGDREIPVIEHPIQWEESQSGFERAPPELGEHNEEVFREIGYSEGELQDLADSGAFGENRTGE
ncbi:MAG: CaiB/BaiF CoA transferase family protein, partial [Halobacteriaceae archaeon]